MSNYGIQPTGYVRKPISVILAELEADMATEFGPGVLQTPQTPLGQLNGLMADLLAEVDERNLDLYQSYDPDQAEGTRLDTLARIRLVRRGAAGDAGIRQAMTNEGQGRIDIQDLSQALSGLPGVTYARVFVNDSGDNSIPELERGFVAVAVIGGSDDEVAAVVRRHVVPGVSTYGNTRVSTTIEGFCRSVSLIRPVEVPVTVRLSVRLRRDRNNCPAPATSAIAATLEAVWATTRGNGQDVSAFTLRSIIESTYSNVEVVSFTATRLGEEEAADQPALIGVMEIAAVDVVEVEVVP